MALLEHASPAGAELAAALRFAAPGAAIDESAISIAGHIHVGAVEAVGEALQAVHPRPPVARIEGLCDSEVPDWFQVVFVLSDGGQPGSDEWSANLATVGAVIETAISRHPEVAGAIASEIMFQL